jgi:hypothetical protein
MGRVVDEVGAVIGERQSAVEVEDPERLHG